MLLGKHTSGAGLQSAAPSEPSLADEVEFLMRRDAYRPRPPEVTRQETHMSRVFLAGDRVYKLKKPVRCPYLDFSTLARREAACRAELRLNRRLAPDTYRGVLPLALVREGLTIGGDGHVVDWLVVMNCLDEKQMLDRIIADGRLHRWQLDRLAAVLVQFSIAALVPCSSRQLSTPRSYGAASPIIAAFCSTRVFSFQQDAWATSTPCSAVS